VNPVYVLPGALAERGEALATEFANSCTLGAGQFCTNPGLVLLIDGAGAEAFIRSSASRWRNLADGQRVRSSPSADRPTSHRRWWRCKQPGRKS